MPFIRAWSVRTEAALSPRTARAGNGAPKSSAAARIRAHVLRSHSGKFIGSPPPPCIEEHPAINAIRKGLLRGAPLGIWMFLPAIKVSPVHKQNRYLASLLAACPVRMSLWVV